MALLYILKQTYQKMFLSFSETDRTRSEGKEMSFFPFFQNIEGKTFLIVGKGSIAMRKKTLLLQFTDQVRVFEDGERKTGPFSQADLKGVDFCIASTDDSAQNSRIAAICHQAGIPVNVPDDPSLCTFYLPSIVKKGDLVIAVSTGGKSPALAAQLRRQIEQQLKEDYPDNLEQILEQMGILRRRLPSVVPDGKDRRQIYSTILRELLEGSLPAVEEEIRARVWTLM